MYNVLLQDIGDLHMVTFFAFGLQRTFRKEADILSVYNRTEMNVKCVWHPYVWRSLASLELLFHLSPTCLTMALPSTRKL